MVNRFKAFQVTRAFSSAGDEMWMTALPIYLAVNGVAASSVGLIFSAGAAGSLLGFVLLPVVCRYFKSANVAANADLVQLVSFVVVLFLIFGKPTGLDRNTWIPIQFILSFCASLWFGATETLITRISSLETAQSAHRWNYLSGSVGPALGPALAGVLYGLFGVTAIALFNAISFLGQAIALKNLSHEETLEESELTDEQPLLKTLVGGVGYVWSDARLRYMTLVSLGLKVFLVGLLPFIAFALSKTDVRPELIGLTLAAFSIGNLVGAFSWKDVSSVTIHKTFAIDTSLAIATTIALNFVLFTDAVNPWISVLTLAVGWFIARYSIALRAMRQQIVSRLRMPTVVASQGFLARLATPLAGILYGAILGGSGITLKATSLLIFLATGSIGVIGTYRAFRTKA